MNEDCAPGENLDQAFWENHGVAFEDLSPAEIGRAIEDLNRIFLTIGEATKSRILGLSRGLTIRGYRNIDSLHESGCTTEDRSCYTASNNTIHLWLPKIQETTLTHEIGHAVDYHAGTNGNYSTGNWVNNVNGWSQIENGEYIFTGRISDLASSYARESPYEDVAETWVWYIYSNAGMTLPGQYSMPDSDRRTEIYILIDNARP